VAELVFTESYTQKAQKFLRKHREMFGQYEKTLQLLEANPFHPSLRLHKLKGKLDGIYSVSINISYRICIDFLIERDQIIPINIGSHDEVY